MAGHGLQVRLELHGQLATLMVTRPTGGWVGGCPHCGIDVTVNVTKHWDIVDPPNNAQLILSLVEKIIHTCMS